MARNCEKGHRDLAITGKRIAWAAAAVIAVLLLYAWIDGGEEPLRPIAQPVDLPETPA
ncbi:hypothetical protein [Pelagerythrobacter sp.]|uniref:hypothetical protein n=1 Tax=Pelagerythrobacter sp. TaxID=2800702 RepID=UPI0035AE6D55